MKKKAIILLFMIIGISTSIIILSNLPHKSLEPIDCDSFGVIYLKPSELKYASGLANKINGVIVIPELNQVIGRTEILSCPNFDYSNYINLGGKL